MYHTQFQIFGCQTVHSSYSLVLPHLRRYAFIPVCSVAHASHPTPPQSHPTPLPFAAATPLPIQSSSSRRSRPTALSNLRYIRSGAEARWGQPFPTPADGPASTGPCPCLRIQHLQRGQLGLGACKDGKLMMARLISLPESIGGLQAKQPFM